MPADNSGECKEEQADGDENITKATHHTTKCGLGQFGTGQSGAVCAGAHDCKYSDIDNDKGVDKDADHCG